MTEPQHLPHPFIPLPDRGLCPRIITGLAIVILSAVSFPIPTIAQTPLPDSVSPDTSSPDTSSPDTSSLDSNPRSTPDPAETSQSENTEPENTESILEAYTLGTGDRINISIFGAPEYSGEALVLPDGSLNLPTAGNVMVRGLTLQEAAQAISMQYAPFLRQPHITVTLVTLRPVRVGIAGAVNRPGSYTLSSEELSEFPTLTDAIQKAGGITSRADLRQIQVHRQQPGSEQMITINLQEMLQTGDLSKDIVLHGGDTVFIPTATAIDPEVALQLGTASFAPDTVTVYVVGEVKSPGAVNLPQNTPLNQAILASGGFNDRQANTESVQLVRLNLDGTVSQRDIPIHFEAGINEASNPSLHHNDVIVVGRSDLANFSEVTEMTLSPFGRILSSFLGILNLFN